MLLRAHVYLRDLGGHIPGQEVLAYITGIRLIAGGMAIFWRRSARAGAVAVAIVYFAPARRVRRLTTVFQPRLRSRVIVVVERTPANVPAFLDLASKLSRRPVQGWNGWKSGKKDYEYEKGNSGSWSCRISVAIAGSASVRHVPHASERSPTRKLSEPGPCCFLNRAGRFGHRRERSGEKRN